MVHRNNHDRLHSLDGNQKRQKMKEVDKKKLEEIEKQLMMGHMEMSRLQNPYGVKSDPRKMRYNMKELRKERARILTKNDLN